MIGNNEMSLNAATIMAAIQHYFDTVLFAEGKSPKVTDVNMTSSVGKTFIIRIENATPPSK